MFVETNTIQFITACIWIDFVGNVLSETLNFRRISLIRTILYSKRDEICRWTEHQSSISISSMIIIIWWICVLSNIEAKIYHQFIDDRWIKIVVKIASFFISIKFPLGKWILGQENDIVQSLWKQRMFAFNEGYQNQGLWARKCNFSFLFIIIILLLDWNEFAFDACTNYDALPTALSAFMRMKCFVLAYIDVHETKINETKYAKISNILNSYCKIWVHLKWL